MMGICKRNTLIRVGIRLGAILSTTALFGLSVTHDFMGASVQAQTINDILRILTQPRPHQAPPPPVYSPRTEDWRCAMARPVLRTDLCDMLGIEYPVILAGMEAPPNLGRAYIERFRRVYRDLVNENDAAFIPFLLAGVAARPELNQADGIHPTLEGQRIMADSVWLYLEPVLRSSSGERKP